MSARADWRGTVISLLTLAVLALPALPATSGERAMDVRIGGTREGAVKTVLDYDMGTGNLFAVVQWGQDNFSVNMSTDGGSSWVETYDCTVPYYLQDLDAVVVGGWLYIADTYQLIAGGRLRRCWTGDGTYDANYGVHGIISSAPHLIDDVALAANSEVGNSMVHYFAGQTDGSIRHVTVNAVTGLTIMETESLGGYDAGLDATYNVSGFEQVFVSFVGLDGAVHAAGYGLNWTDHIIASIYSGLATKRTAISAHHDTVICVYSHDYLLGYGIRGQISNDSGNSWSPRTIAEPLPGEDDFYSADVCARGGDGMAVVYHHEEGADDPFLAQVRTEYVAGSWEEETRISDYDVDVYSWTTINRIPPLGGSSEAYSFGAIYLANSGSMYPYFDRIEGLPTAGDSCGDPLEITLPAALPFEDDDTTCGRGNDYAATCMGNFDEGEDTIYRLTVTEEVAIDIRVTAFAASYPGYAGIAVFSECPANEPDSCIATAVTGVNPDRIQGLTLTPGEYYLMIDSWPPPDCTAFNLVITLHCDEECPPGAIDEGENCGSDTNGGCTTGSGFTQIQCGQTVCGTSWGEWETFDGDWYQVELNEHARLTWTVTADFYVMMGLIEMNNPGSANCADMTGVIEPCGLGGPCEEVSVTTEVLPPGTHWVYLCRQWFLPSFGCSDSNGYVATLTCTPTTSISAGLTCIPSTGTVPFNSSFTVTMTNLNTSYFRQVAGRIDVITAGGGSYSNWRSGYTNLSPGESFTTGWTQNIPALSAIVGENQFTLLAEDVTPAPYNQPPYPPAGTTDRDKCEVTGIAP